MNGEAEDARVVEGAPAAKAALRRRMRAKLADLPPGERRRAEERLAARVLDLPEVGEARGVMSCLSFGTEPDTWELVEGLVAAGKEVFVPRAEAGDPRLHVHPWPSPLRTLEMGLRQPPPDAPEVLAEELPEWVQVVLVLGLAFERRRGYRLGYGGGYFDRFLAGVDALPVGLAFDLQLVDELPAEPHDMPMGIVVTEERVLRFPG